MTACTRRTPSYEAARSALRAGELDTALHDAEEGIAGAAANSAPQWRFRLLRCEILLARQSPAKALSELRNPMPESGSFTVLAARKKSLEGLALMKLGRFPEAAAALAAARQLAERSEDAETQIDAETNQGTLLLRTGRWDDAEETLQAAFRRARARSDAYLQAGTLIDLGMSRLNRRRYDEAAEYFGRAASLTAAFPNLYFVSQANLASCYYHLGEPDRAIRLQLAAIRQFERSGARAYLQSALGEAGNAYLMNGQFREGAGLLSRALDAAKQAGSNADAAIWAGSLALVYTELGQWNDAERLNQESIRLKKIIHPEGTGQTFVYNKLNAARIAIGRKDFATGESLYRQALVKQPDPGVRWDAWAGLAGAAMLRGNPAAATPFFEAAVATVEQTRSDLLSTEFKLPFLTQLIRVYQQYVDALVAQGDTDGALAVAESSRAQVLAQRFGSAPVRRQSPAALKKIAAASGSVFLSWWLGPEHSHAWIVSADAIRHVDLPPGPEIARLAADYNDAIQRRLANPLTTPVPSGQRLFEILVQPVLPGIPPGSRVIVVPDGALNGLNLETLVVPGPVPHYWIEDALIAVAPSISSLGNRPTQPAGKGVLVIGDAETSDPAFPPLLHAAAEMDSVENHFDPASRVVLRRKEATLNGYLSADPGRFAAIHFAAHATANRETPLASAVLLTGGKLYARNVIELPLHADLVTISACQSAGLRIYSGEGLVGFAWAFLRAGARNVIAGLWDVNDQSTAALMDITYRELTSGHRPDEALRTAKLAQIHSKLNFQKPYYWGPFQVYTVAPARP